MLSRSTAKRWTAVIAVTVLASALVTSTPALAGPDDSVGGPSLGEPPEPIAPPGSDGGGTAEKKLGPQFASGKYVVTLARPPIASYQGGTANIPRTKPAAGARVDATTQAAQDYAQVLQSDQSAVAQSVGATPDQRYTVALNGFAANLSSAQAQALSTTPGVLSVAKDTIRRSDNDANSTDFLRLSGPNGLWHSLGGTKNAGKGVVIGVIDTGIWPESKSFAAPALGDAPDANDPTKAYRSGDTVVMHKINGQQFTGACVAGQDFTADLCNTKVISARFFGDDFLASGVELAATEHVSPRDGDGHGSHTASTAAGNNGVRAVVDGINFGQISGVAPGASIAVYKALWDAANPAASGGTTSDILAAIDQAVEDGVDVINYSVGGGSESPADDPIALAFLSAASAGIFVSASAGNAGPGPSTMDNTQPWVTTVAASTVGPREATVVLGNGAEYAGISTTVQNTVGPVALLAAQNNALPPATAAAAALCTPGSLDPAKVTGAIVQCDRGVVNRVAKSAEVKRAGGIGMVLTNLTDGSTDGDLHSVPSVHINVPAGPTIKAYALTAGATATLRSGNLTSVAIPYPQVAGFSSRGPALATGENILKPDVAAPGVTILAAVAPPAHLGRDFDFESGTSMAAPHIAGLAAIYKNQQPTWSPMAIKSALMTTAYDTKNPDGSTFTDPFAQGAGQVDATRMLNPALIYDAGDLDWLGYLEGVGVATGTGVPAIDPSDYNQASFADGDLVQSKVFTRKVTAVKTGLYRATVSVPGFRASVSPSILNFNTPGQTRTFRVTLTRTSAPLNAYAKGFLTWHGANTSVRSPIAVKPVAAKTSASLVEITGSSGSASWTVTSGVRGAFPISSFGMAAGNPQPGSVTATGFEQYVVTVADGTKLARFSTKVPDPTDGSDIDLLVFLIDPSGGVTLVGQSAGSSPNEQVDVKNPTAGTYVAEVDGFSLAPGTTATAFSFRHYLVAADSADGDLSVEPSNPTTTPGQQIAVTARVSGLDAEQQYLGWVEYPGGTGTLVVANPDK
jgi:subtilisin family serine protease